MMIIGALTMELRIDGAFSLKDKRAVLNRVRDRVRRKFNVSLAEVDANEVWNRACIGIVTVSNEQVHANRVLSKVVAFFEADRECEVEDFSMEFL